MNNNKSKGLLWSQIYILFISKKIGAFWPLPYIHNTIINPLNIKRMWGQSEAELVRTVASPRPQQLTGAGALSSDHSYPSGSRRQQQSITLSFLAYPLHKQGIAGPSNKRASSETYRDFKWLHPERANRLSWCPQRHERKDRWLMETTQGTVWGHMATSRWAQTHTTSTIVVTWLITRFPLLIYVQKLDVGIRIKVWRCFKRPIIE